MFHTAKKVVNAVIPTALVNNASVVGQVIDTQGFEYLEVYVQLGATDIALTALKLQESDVKASATSLTGGTDISAANTGTTGTVFGTDAKDTGAASVLPSATDDFSIYKFEVDLRGRKRYILPVVTVGNGATGAYVAAIAELSRGAQVPTTAAEKGVAQLMRV